MLAGASAMRYYLVTSIGERVVADLRDAVFDRITILSAAFFDTAKSGELVSRLTADTTQIKAAVGASVSIALRNLVLFFGSAAMMVVTSARLSAFVLGAIPVIVLPLVAFGRMVRKRSRTAQDTLADASAYASELIGAVRTLQAFTNEKLARTRFRDAVERAYDAALYSIRARAMLTAIIIFLAASSVVVVLWVGAQDVLAGRTIGGNAQPVRAVRGVRGERAGPAQRGLGRAVAGVRLRRAAVGNPAHRARDQGAGKSAAAAARRRAAKSASTRCASPTRRVPGRSCWTA